MLLTFDQTLDIARERYQTLLVEVTEARMARQARLPLAHRAAHIAGSALVRAGARLLEVGKDERTRTVGVQPSSTVRRV